MKLSFAPLLFLPLLFSSCAETEPVTAETEVKEEVIEFQNKGHELVYNMSQTIGDYQELLKRKDVSYTYTYKTPDGKEDISTEKYIFDGELSYGSYVKHERTLPELEGSIEQGFDGTNFWLRNNGEYIEDEAAMKRVMFNRKTNFYWFAMMQKLMDDAVIYEYIDEAVINNKTYDIVKTSFKSVDNKPTDIYQVYINRETSMVDQFLFTVVDFDVVEEPMLMQLEYQEVDGIMIPGKRKYQKSTWEATVSDAPWIEVYWTDITFNNQLDKAFFTKNGNDMTGEENNQSLKSQLDAKKVAFEQKADDEKKRIYREGIEAVENSGVLTSAKQVGDKAPNFTLVNALGEKVELNDYLKKGKVVLTWYRGGWCPYCNMTLHELQEELPNFEANGANLLALTPELPDSSLNTSEKHDLKFEVLSDVGNKVANTYGIVFELTPEVAEIYNRAFKLNDYNGDESNELPLSATYIIDQDGTISYAFLDADYRNRAEPSEITEKLKEAPVQ